MIGHKNNRQYEQFLHRLQRPRFAKGQEKTELPTLDPPHCVMRHIFMLLQNLPTCCLPRIFINNFLKSQIHQHQQFNTLTSKSKYTNIDNFNHSKWSPPYVLSKHYQLCFRWASPTVQLSFQKKTWWDLDESFFPLMLKYCPRIVNRYNGAVDYDRSAQVSMVLYCVTWSHFLYAVSYTHLTLPTIYSV